VPITSKAFPASNIVAQSRDCGFILFWCPLSVCVCASSRPYFYTWNAMEFFAFLFYGCWTFP